MNRILPRDPRVVVQGITGNQGRLHTEAMLKYGTKVVAGTSPGKRGQTVHGVPVYETVAEAKEEQGANTSIVFVPAKFAPAAVLEAIEAGMETIVVITELIPQKDAIDFINKAEKKGIVIVGPNTPGAIAPPIRAKVGIMPDHVFRPGNIGIVSRSGTLTYEIAHHLSNARLGQSLCVGIGGDPIVGLDFITVLDMFEADPETKGVVLIGEVGGVAEEMAARHIAQSQYPKPVVAYVAGRSVPPGKRMGHAGAIIMGGEGTAKSKIEALNKAGVPVAERPSDIAALMKPRLRI
ncbi:MAG: succinate--CoA ligase subunit alpha [Dehalococcoidia bacterium]|nr:succinate--CoA ligase subunit alpha [Dehalococcoidia bacterium]